jgi:hypothetical protein
VAACATVLHVAMHYVVMVQKAEEEGGDSVTKNALGTRSGLTGHAVLFLMALMFLTAWDRCVRRGASPLPVGKRCTPRVQPSTQHTRHHMRVACVAPAGCAAEFPEATSALGKLAPPCCTQWSRPHTWCYIWRLTHP